MDVTCESCRASYRVDDAKIPAQGIKARCPKCGHSFFLKKPDPLQEEPTSSNPIPAPEANPFAAGFAAPAAAAEPDPFANGFGGNPQGFGGSPQGFGGAAAPTAFGGEQPAANDPFAAGGVFGSGFGDPSAAGQIKTAFEIRRVNGQEIGPFDMFHIKQMIYEQQLLGNEAICDASGNWVPIINIEELGEIFRLTGATMAPSPADAQPRAPQQPRQAPSPRQAPREAPQREAHEPAMPVPTHSEAPMPAIDSAGKRTASERMLIMVEQVWAMGKKTTYRIVGGVVAGLLLLTVLAFVFKGAIYHALGWDKKIQAAALILEGDRTLGSNERGPLLGAAAKYREAVARYPDGVLGAARLAEADARILWLDPTRFDLKTEADANLARAAARGKSDPALHRAIAALALARHDLGVAEAEIKQGLSATPPTGAEEVAEIEGDIALEKGDLPGATAAFGKAGPRGLAGIARARIKGGDFAGAATAAADSLKAEPDNGMVMAIAAFVTAHANGADAAAARKQLRLVADGPLRFGQYRSWAEYALGVLYEGAAEPGVALDHYRAAVEFYPTDGEALAAARRLFQSRYSDRPVETWMTSISKIRGSNAMGKIQEGEAQYAVHNWTGAMTPLLAAATDDGNSAMAQLAFARLESAIGAAENAKAKGYFEKAVTVDPTWADAFVAYSNWELAQKDIAGARANGEKAIAIDPTLPDAYEAAAAAAMAGKDPASAVKWLVTATELDPDDYATWMNLGEARRRSGDAKNALAPLQKAATLKPDVAEPLIRLGNAYEDLGDLHKAGDAYSEAAKVEPTNIKVALRAGVVKAKSGDDYAGAAKQLEALLKDHSEVAEADFFLGVSYQYTGEPEKAAEAYRQAIKRDYADAYLAHFHLGEILGVPGGIGDKDQAREHLKATLQARPDFYQAHEELSKIALQNNEFDDAIKELKSVDDSTAKMKPADRNPILERVRLQEGKIAHAQNRNKEAEGDFNQVLKINSRSAEALFNLGELFKDNEPRKAKQFYLKAVAANAAYAPPYKPLGYMSKEDGDDCAARRQWNKFVSLSTSADEKKEMGDELQTLQCDR